MSHGNVAPNSIAVASGHIREFPIGVASLPGRKLCFFGGGYLRLFPYPPIRQMVRQVLA